MIQPTNRIIEDRFVNLTDYKKAKPEGTTEFFTFVGFEDDSECMLSCIYAADRKDAVRQVLDRFADCLGYISNISLQESQS